MHGPAWSPTINEWTHPIGPRSDPTVGIAGSHHDSAHERRVRCAGSPDRFALLAGTVAEVTITCVHCGSTTMRAVADPVYGVQKWACYVCFNQTRLEPGTGTFLSSP